MADSAPSFGRRQWPSILLEPYLRTWRRLPVWLRHTVYWAVALFFLVSCAINQPLVSASLKKKQPWYVVPWIGFADVGVILIACAVLFFTIRGWERVSVMRSVSRSLVLVTFVFGFVAYSLFVATHFGVHIEACHMVGEKETCQGQASAQQVLGMLAWHASNVVPVLNFTDSVGWSRPARSEYAVVGVSILAVRVWVAVGLLYVLKERFKEKWSERVE